MSAVAAAAPDGVHARRRKVTITGIFIALIGVAATWFAFAFAVSGIARVANPSLALKFVPDESMALAGRADQLLLANPGKPPAAVRTMAQDALRQQAINPRALRVLGLYASAKDQDAAAGRFMKMAQAQSRREVVVQFWMIEDAVQRGDVKNALVHYDLALRTKPSTYVTLFPILTSAVEDASIRTAFAPYLRSGRTWTDAFLTHAVANSGNLPALADLFAASGAMTDKGAPSARGIELLRRLVDERQFEVARRLYAYMPGANAARLATAGFDDADRRGIYGAMGWQARNDAQSGSGLQRGNKGSTSLSVFANASTTAIVATKLLYLRPGTYRLSAEVALAPGFESGFVRWQLRCPARDRERPVWQIDARNGVKNAGLTVPAGCNPQYLDIVAASGTAQNGMEATISAVSLQPQ